MTVMVSISTTINSLSKNSNNSQGKLTFKGSAIKKINYLGPVKSF